MTWSEVVFESLFEEKTRNGIYKSKEHHGSGIPIVNMGELFSLDRIGNQKMSLIQMTPKEIETSGLRDGDLLFGRRSLVEEGAGKCSIIHKPNTPMTFESSIIRVRLNEKIANPEFYFNYFRSDPGRSKVKSIISGTAVKGIRGSDLKGIHVHLPPLKTQFLISKTISSYDDLIAINQRRIALLEEAARRLYREWFVNLRFPGHESVRVRNGIPEEWKKGYAYDFISILSGGTPKTKVEHYWGGDIPFFTPKDATSNFFVHKTEKSLTREGLQNCNSQLFNEGAIFITARGTVGKINMAQTPMAMNQSCYALKPKNELDNNFLFMSISDSVSHLKPCDYPHLLPH